MIEAATYSREGWGQPDGVIVQGLYVGAGLGLLRCHPFNLRCIGQTSVDVANLSCDALKIVFSCLAATS
eukprot:2648153-Amphidinium_carterae.3